MTNFEVEMAAFDKGNIRIVQVPEKEVTGVTDRDLERIYHWGQNDFQPKMSPSVSVGDVIRYEKKRYIVSTVGFSEIPPEEKGGLEKGYGFKLS